MFFFFNKTIKIVVLAATPLLFIEMQEPVSCTAASAAVKRKMIFICLFLHILRFNASGKFNVLTSSN